jgi:hypothetical protein
MGKNNLEDLGVDGNYNMETNLYELNGWIWTVCGSEKRSITGFCIYRKERRIPN